MLPARRGSGFSKVSPYPVYDRAHIEPSSGQRAFPIIHIIGNAFWLEVPVADFIFKVFKLACNNTIGN